MTALFLLPLLTACVGDVSEGKIAAEVSDVPAAEHAEPAAPPASGTELAIDASKSTIHALGAKISATHPIDFKKWSGSVKLDGDTLTDLDFSVDMDSLEADHPKLTGHLKNEDFFAVEQFPTATFDASSIKADTDAEGMTHTIEGVLTIRGQAKQVSFPAKIAVDASGVKAKTEFSINRQDFGVSYPGKADDLVQDNVVLTVNISAPRG